jgi:hypothetical protein
MELTMPKTIFSRETGGTEERIVVNDDGTVTRQIENAGWVAYKSGIMPREETLPAKEAKAKWGHTKEIDVALAEIGSSPTK